MAWCVLVGGTTPIGLRKTRTFKTRQDSINGVLLNDDLEPVGNRIEVPLPGWLREEKTINRGKRIQYNKLFAIAAKGFY